MGVATVKTGRSALVPPKRQDRYRSPIDKAKGYEVIWQQVAPVFEATRDLQGVEFVYFIGEEDDGPVKIGHSKDPIARLRAMQTGNPRRLRVEHVLVGGLHTEQVLHEIWAKHAIISTRQKGKVDALPGTEWFRPDIRTDLDPIVRTAVEKHVEFLRAAEGDILGEDLERLIREAHGAHDYMMWKRDEVLLLAQGAGYVTRRRSRL